MLDIIHTRSECCLSRTIHFIWKRYFGKTIICWVELKVQCHGLLNFRLEEVIFYSWDWGRKPDAVRVGCHRDWGTWLVNRIQQPEERDLAESQAISHWKRRHWGKHLESNWAKNEIRIMGQVGRRNQNSVVQVIGRQMQDQTSGLGKVSHGQEFLKLVVHENLPGRILKTKVLIWSYDLLPLSL